jgi:hypothetical protein
MLESSIFFQKILEPPQIFTKQKDDMKQVSCQGTKNIRREGTKCSHPANPAHTFCVLLI